jgi:hypothetical protein
LTPQLKTRKGVEKIPTLEGQRQLTSPKTEYLANEREKCSGRPWRQVLHNYPLAVIGGIHICISKNKAVEK